MNFLQMVQMVKREGGISGAVPSTVLNQVEEINRIAGWVNSAWMDIQVMHENWEWMRKPVSFNTTAYKNSYTPIEAGIVLNGVSNLGNWRRPSFRRYLLANGVSGEQILPFLSYNEFRDLYLYGVMRLNVANPVVFSIDPMKNLLLGNSPNDVYVINGEYWTQPTQFVLDVDAPTMPPQFHLAIVWRALGFYGMYEAAGEAVSRGKEEFTRYASRLELDQLPRIIFGEPLA